MRAETLPSPGLLAQGYDLRRVSANAISGVEMAARRAAGGRTATARQLQAFFTACATALNALVEIVLPTVTTRVRTAVNTATITFSEALQPGALPLTSFSFSPVRTVTAVNVVGSTVVVTATGVIATDNVTYTQPVLATDFKIKDLAGNIAANFAGVLA